LGAIPRDASAAYYAAGYPPDAHIGLSGLERVFQARLAGSPGGELRAGERLIASAPARPGTAVRTSISTALQREAVAALANQQGAIAVLRPSTGEILALAGIPLSGLQPPGSTFKMVTVTGVLEAHLATVRTQFPVRTEAILSGVPLQNANGESCGGTLAEAFAQSCNSVFAPLGARLGARRLVAVAERFGFNEPTGIPGAATSSIPPPSAIPDDLAAGSTAIGQGEVQASTLQMALAAATIANEGRRPRPTLLRGAPASSVNVTSPRVARTVRKLMLEVVRSGTGTSAQITGVKVAGKTGTAELRSTVCTPADQSGCATSGDPRNTDAWFVAFAPATAPRVVVGVVLVGAGAGGDSAAPLAAEVLRTGLSRR
jgi:cell division protein FtsI/penicillin-binding protein 2